MQELKSMHYAFHLIFRPFDGFWDLKHEKRGNLKAALTIMAMLCITYILRRQLTGFLFNTTDLTRLNIFVEIMSVVIPFGLWCVSNWCLTTLMDGEGSFKDIVITTGYALAPLVIINVPLILLSNVMTAQEGAFYYFFDTVAVIWSAGLIFLGTMVVHQYTMFKTFLTTVCIIGGMGLIIFIGLLFFSLLQQMVSFIYIIYKELSLRL